MAEKKLTSTRRAVTVNVTQAIIDRAEEKNSNHCMIADAIRVALPDARAVSVDMATIRFTDPVRRQRYVYLTPRSVQLALIEFDQGEHTEPFNLRLVTPVQVTPVGAKTLPDGTRQRPSRALQGIVEVSGGTARPTKLGGTLPPKDELNMGGSGLTNKKIAAAERQALAAAAEREAVEAEKRAVAAAKAKKLRKTAPQALAEIKAEAEKAAADRAEGKPATAASNITMEQTSRRHRHVRAFGLKQLRA